MINEGSIAFHKYNIKQSYRIRGNVQRHHTNNVANNITLNINKILFKTIPNIIRTLNILINNIDIYSPKKSKAKYAALNSVLNPDTNSDSPSAKSKGVRCLSLKQIINHRNPKG